MDTGNTAFANDHSPRRSDWHPDTRAGYSAGQTAATVPNWAKISKLPRAIQHEMEHALYSSSAMAAGADWGRWVTGYRRGFEDAALAACGGGIE